MDHGPWAARYFAARIYAQHWGYLPRNSDWAAQSLPISAPPFLDGVSSSVRAKSPAAPLPSKQMSSAHNPQVGARLKEGVSPSDEDSWNRRRRPGSGMRSPSPSPSTTSGKSTPRSYSGDKGGRRINGAPPKSVVDIEIAPRARALTALQDPAPGTRHLPRKVKIGIANGSEK